jgi:uncharacterized membrane protein
MLKLATAYLCAGATFIALDAAFLTLVGSRLYRPELDLLLADKVRATPAVLFYLLYVAGLVHFCVRPGLAAGWRQALFAGLAFGLVAYGTYDLTCQAVMRAWSWKITLVDLAWGMSASAIASVVGVLATRALVSKHGAAA